MWEKVRKTAYSLIIINFGIYILKVTNFPIGQYAFAGGFFLSLATVMYIFLQEMEEIDYILEVFRANRVEVDKELPRYIGRDM